MPKIMLVDDERNILSSLRRAIASMPWAAVGEAIEIETFDSPLAALARGREHAFDLVVSDYRMPEMDGVTFLEQLIQLQPEIARIVLSGYADIQAVIGAINRTQIFRFVAKPWEECELNSAIAEALEHRRLILDNARLADMVRVQEGRLSRQDVALKELEHRYPGITRINRAADGSIDLELDADIDLEADTSEDLR